jgi:hypothetical protein
MTQTLAPPRTPQRPDLRQTGRTPSIAGYWLGALIAMVGLVLVGALVATAIVRMNDHIDAFPRIALPGVTTVTLDASTGRTIYVEGLAPLPLAAIGLRVTDPNGNDVLVRPYGLDVRYDVPGATGSVGYAVGTFRTTVAGRYLIEANGVAPPGYTVAVGDNFAASVIGYAAGAIALFLLTLAGALTLVIVTATRRSRARRA